MIAREIITRLRFLADSSGLRRYQQQAAGAVAQARNAASRIREANVQAAKATGDAWGGVRNVLAGVMSGISAVSIAKVADEWASVEGRVGLVTDGLDEQKMVLAELYAAAQRNGQAYSSVADLFASVARNKKELGLTTSETLQMTDVIGKAITIGGGSAESAKAALVQLGQALGTGVLRGEELNSVMEQAPRLAKAIAEAFNVPVGQLKKLGEQGKLDAKILAKGLLAQAEKLQSEFDRMPKTFARAWTMVSNRFGKAIDQWNKSTKASERFYRIAEKVIERFDDIVHAIALIAGSIGMTKLIGWISKATAANGGLLASLALIAKRLAPFLRWMVILEGISLIVEDIVGWFNGVPSLLGDIIGPMSQWAGWIAKASEFFAPLVDWIGIGADKVGDLAVAFGPVGTAIAAVVLLLGVKLIAVIGLVAGAIWLIHENWDTVSAAFKATIDWLAGAWKRIRDNAVQQFDELKAVWAGLSGSFDATMKWFSSSWDSLRSKVLGIFDSIASKWASVKQTFSFDNLASKLPDWARNALPGGGVPAVQAPSAGAMQKQSGSTGTWAPTTTNTININTADNPAAVGAAAARGVQRGTDAALSRAMPLTEAAA